ncbi:MAG: malonate transporter [Hyphomicrobiales bacterium]|nr:MAG: malonate transporter [Hyphomicrobiales bacterium]
MLRTLPFESSNSLLDVFQIIFPIFALLGLGYVVVKFGYLPEATAGVLSNFAVRLAVPVLLFRAIYQLEFKSAFHFQMLASFYVAAFFCFATAIFLARVFWKRRPGEAVAIGFTAYFSNSVLLGLAITERAYGESVLTPVFGILTLHVPILYTVGMISMELARRDGKPLGETILKAFKSIFSSPLMLGIMLGAACNVSGIVIPEIIMTPVNMLADSAITVAIIGIGATLTRYKLNDRIGETAMVTAVSLILHPAVALLISHYILDLPKIYVLASVVVAAMPPGVNGYIFASLYDRAVSVAASSLVMASVFSVVTITGWLLILDHLL